MSERKYFLVGAYSPAMQVIQKCIGEQRAFREWLELFKQEFGASDAYTYGNARFAGLVFQGDIPEGWRQKAGKPFCVPALKSKAGREIHRRLSTYPVGVDSWRFSSMLGREYSPYADGHVYLSTYEKHGDQYILSIPAQCNVYPTGCTPLKMSEYWRIVEDAKAVAA